MLSVFETSEIAFDWMNHNDKELVVTDSPVPCKEQM